MLNINLKDLTSLIKAGRPAEGMPDDWKSGATSATNMIAINIARHVLSRNPDFDSDEFLEQCGVEDDLGLL